jgi:hypothetical protein
MNLAAPSGRTLKGRSQRKMAADWFAARTFTGTHFPYSRIEDAQPEGSPNLASDAPLAKRRAARRAERRPCLKRFPDPRRVRFLARFASSH